MDRLKKLLFVFLMLAVIRVNCAGAEEAGPITVDWVNQELNITGTGYIIPGERGNYIQWQHESAQRAKANLIRNYILSMYLIRLDAFLFASDLMKLEPERNEPVYDYISNEKKLAVQYTDNTVVCQIKTARLAIVDEVEEDEEGIEGEEGAEGAEGTEATEGATASPETAKE